MEVARSRDKMMGIEVVSINKAIVKRGQEYVTVVLVLEAKRLLFMTPGRSTMRSSTSRPRSCPHDGAPNLIEHVCMDMSAAYTKGITEALQKAQFNYNRCHVVALGNKATVAKQREEM